MYSRLLRSLSVSHPRARRSIFTTPSVARYCAFVLCGVLSLRLCLRREYVPDLISRAAFFHSDVYDANTTKLTLYTLSFSTQIRIKQATWTDPLIAPWIDEETGKKYWTTADGTATWESPGNWKEEWSTEHKMPFYVNKKTSESTWDLPEELAWERVNHEVEDTL